MIGRQCRKRFTLLPFASLLITSAVCCGDVYQDLDFRVWFSTSWDGRYGKLYLHAQWRAPKKSISMYWLHVKGRIRAVSGRDTSATAIVFENRYDSSAEFSDNVDSYLFASHTYILEAHPMVGEDLFDIYEYSPPHVLVIENRMGDASGVASTTFELVHCQDGTEGLDAEDSEYTPNLMPRQAKIVSRIWDNDDGRYVEFMHDSRPLGSTSDISLELSLVSASDEPIQFSSSQTSELVFSMPGLRYGCDFDSRPITIQQYDPDDPSAEFPIYDVRKAIAKRDGVIALMDLVGTYESNDPYACCRVSYTRDVAGDMSGDGRLDLYDLAALGRRWRQTRTLTLADIAGRDGLGLPDGEVNGFDLMAFCQEWAGVVRDGFETGNLESLPWLKSGFPFWKVVSSQSRSGSYCAQAGPIDDGGRTALMLSARCRAGRITFWRKVSSERNYDVLRFLIDREVVAEWSGELDWERVSFPVKEGSRMFAWEYTKDDYSAGGDDTAWIDDVLFPAP